jgi:hypothetical protein
MDNSTEEHGEDRDNAMGMNESDSTNHKARPVAKRDRRSSTVATARTRAQDVTRETPTVRPGDDQIRLRAYEIYLRRDGRPGDPMDDWFCAERELIAEGPAQPAPKGPPRPARKRS